MKHRKTILFLCLHLFPLLLHAQPILLVERADSVIKLGSHTLFFESTGKHVDLQEILKPEANRQFHKEKAEVPNFTQQSNDVWFKFTIQNKTGKPLFLQISNLYLDTIEIYAPDSASHYQIHHTGFGQPFSAREFPSVNYLIQLDDGQNEEPLTYYGNIRSIAYHFWIPLEVGSLSALTTENRKTEFISVGILAILLVMFFYNAFLGLVVKEKIYLYYVFYVLTAAYYNIYYRGYLLEWVGNSSVPSNMPVALLYITLLLFTNEILNLKKDAPYLIPISYILLAVSFILMVSPSSTFFLSQFLIDFMNIAFPTYLIIASILSLRAGNKLTYIFLAGWTPLMIAAFLYVILRNGAFYSQFFSFHGVGIAMAWEVTLFSLMLGYRFNKIRQEKIQAQAENLKLINEQNLKLENMVIDRTQEITRQNGELRQHQEEILAQRDMLEAQNRELEESKRIINSHNQELESAVEQRTVELAEINEELKRQFRQMEQFSFIAAHNLRGPVARILGLTNIFDLQPNAHLANVDILNKITRSAQDLDTIIHDLGAILDVQKGKQAQYETIDVNHLLEKIKLRFAKEIEDYHFTVSIVSKVPGIISIPAYLDSILTNLLSNSIKYKSVEHPPIVEIEIGTKEDLNYIVVSDNGIGFDSQKYSSKIFEPFQRFNTNTEGKGLGLFLIKTQVTALKGTLTLHSQIGKGTRVEIHLPQTPEDSSTAVVNS